MTTSKRTKWTVGLELIGMLLILVSFYYQTFYEGDNLRRRYDNIRFKLKLIHNEVIQNSKLIGNQSEYNFGNAWKGFDRNKVNEISEDYISTVDKIQAQVSSIRAWIFICGSFLVILSKYFQHFWIPANTGKPKNKKKKHFRYRGF